MSIVIDATNITKTFKIHHEKRDTVFETLSGWVNKKKYSETISVLKDLTFSVNSGEMFGIIGKNGIGKTTLLRLLAGIYTPDSGQLNVHGKITPFLSLGVGFHPDFTATMNVVQYGILLGFSRPEIEQLVPKIMQFGELEQFADTALKNFSTGMLARLAFSTAMQVNPDILLIDEILQVGDLSFHKKSFDAIMSFKKRGKTIVFVTHDLNSIQEYCDKAMFLQDGQAQIIGDPREVVESYKNSLLK